jgi:undecaprenyl-diphosphatase
MYESVTLRRSLHDLEVAMAMQELSSPVAPSSSWIRERIIFLILSALAVIVCVVLAVLGYIQPVVLGIVQGLTEFMPVSSAAHLILMRWFFQWQSGMTDPFTFDLALHLGTLIALLGYFWRDWAELLGSTPGVVRWGLRRARGDRSYTPTLGEQVLPGLIIATIPGIIFGALLEPYVEYLRSPRLLAVMLTFVGLLLYTADTRRPERLSLERITWRHSLLIGLAQACALIPGISRLGATITMARFLTIDRSAATRYSFLLSAPITLAAILFNIDALLAIPSNEIIFFAVGVFISAFIGALTIHLLLDFVGRFGFSSFAVYRALLAIAIVVVYFMRA